MTVPTTEPQVEQPTAAPASQGDPEQLADPGKKALNEERAAKRAAEKRASELQQQLDALNRANESALEKAQREAAELSELAKTARAEALRWRIAAKHGISDEDAETFLTGADEETLTRQAKRLAALNTTPADTSAPGPRPDLTQGGKSGPVSNDPAKDFANFLQNQLTK